MDKTKISYSDFDKLDLRVAKILQVEEVEGADKLYKLKVYAGPEIGERIICAGLKTYYEKEEPIGKKIIFFVNLEPRKIRGIESQGMLLAAQDEEGKVKIIVPEEDVSEGSIIR